MKVPILVTVLIAIFTACENNRTNSRTPTTDTILISNTDRFSPTAFPKDTQVVIYSGVITLPKGWRLANDDTLFKAGDATSRYRFHNKKGKLIFLQYGLSTIGNPSEPKVQPAIFRNGYVRNNADTSEIIFTDNPHLIEIRKKSNYLYSSGNISAFQATFFKPKQIGNGYIGIYIDSIGQIASNIADLVLYADGLDSLESKEFEKVSRSLIIKDFK